MIKSIDKAIQIMNVIANSANNTPTLKYISTVTKINKSTCVRIIDTLIKNGMLIKISVSKGYFFGPRAYLWTNNGRFFDGFIRIAEPVLRWLNKKLDKTVTLATVINNKKYIIDFIESDTNFFNPNYHIIEDSFYHNATGILLLANLDKNEIFDIYSTQKNLPKQLGWSEVKNFNDFYTKLTVIRKNKTFKNINPRGTNDVDYINIGYGHLIKCGYKIYGAIGVAIQTKDISTVTENEEQKVYKHLNAAAKEIEKRILLNEESTDDYSKK